MTRHPLSEAFHQELALLGKLHDQKQADYGLAGDPFYNVRGSEEWGIPAWQGAMMRAQDKVRRLQKEARHPGTLQNESAMDIFRDLAVYALTAAVLYQEQQK